MPTGWALRSFFAAKCAHAEITQSLPRLSQKLLSKEMLRLFVNCHWRTLASKDLARCNWDFAGFWGQGLKLVQIMIWPWSTKIMKLFCFPFTCCIETFVHGLDRAYFQHQALYDRLRSQSGAAGATPQFFHFFWERAERRVYLVFDFLSRKTSWFTEDFLAALLHFFKSTRAKIHPRRFGLSRLWHEAHRPLEKRQPPPEALLSALGSSVHDRG